MIEFSKLKSCGCLAHWISRPILFGSLFSTLTACQAIEQSNPYRLPDHLFSSDMPEDKGQLAIGYVEAISHRPRSECEREDLRQFLIIADWQMNDFNSQSYFLDAKSEGVKIILDAFPELSEQPILAERGNLVFSLTLRERLIDIKTSCKRSIVENTTTFMQMFMLSLTVLLVLGLGFFVTRYGRNEN